MSSEETLIAVRKAKHQEINGGTYPLASSQARSIAAARVWMEVNPPKVSIIPEELSENNRNILHGRITNLRKSGGISFIKIVDATGSLQLIASKSVLNNYNQLSLLDLGDIIEVVGLGCISKSGEKSLLLLDWKVLTKSHRSPPEKWDGLANQELKYRKRYLDLMSDSESRARFITRSKAIRAIRSYMDAYTYMEVETPTLNVVSSGANAKPFTTHHNALDTDLFLRIAPELYLKRLLVGGYEQVYEIGRNYRNEGISARHNPEFTMMEAYKAYGSFEELFPFTENLLHHVDKKLSDSDLSGCYSNWSKERPWSLSEFKRVTMLEAVKCGVVKIGMAIDPITLQWDCEDPSWYGTDRASKIDSRALDAALNTATTWGTKLEVWFEHIVEPFLTEDYRTTDGTRSCPVFITDYPAEICPLARKNDLNPQVCDRFELFVNGMELCNAFQELNDPDEQAKRFREQLSNGNKDPMDYDASYVEALEMGMPPAVGLGMGVDRLCLLLTNAQSIKDVILFPTLKPEKPCL